MSALRVIGDVHAQIDFALRRGRRCYLELIEGCPCTLQIGDMGDREAYEVLVSRVDASTHRFFAGNHDHYDCLPAHSLGDFGTSLLGGVQFFFLRGAASIDKQKLQEMGHRVGRKLWFSEEELNDEQMAKARHEFVQAKPAIMMSHEAPTRVAGFVSQDVSRGFVASRTSDFLQTLLDVHSPKLWLFGHYHRDWDYAESGTHFHCVGELSFVDIDSDGNFISN